jgi:predicted transcriptional regulator
VKYRSRSEIAALILEIANGNRVSQTKIIQNSYISYEQVKDYLLILIRNDLLEYEKQGRTYKTTHKGILLLHIYNKISKLVEPEIR